MERELLKEYNLKEDIELMYLNYSMENKLNNLGSNGFKEKDLLPPSSKK